MQLINWPIVFAIACFIFSSFCYAASFETNATYDICFTPGQDCTTQIIEEIKKAKYTIHVQSFIMTSKLIALSLIKAANNNIKVFIIVDKRQVEGSYNLFVKNFLDNNIPIWIDTKPAIAHNKVIIIDNDVIITGSFNFTVAAQEHNAENIIIIHDSNIATIYNDYWNKRKNESKKYDKYSLS